MNLISHSISKKIYIGILVTMNLAFMNVKPLEAKTGVDVYVVFAGKDKQEKQALAQALDGDLSIKFYNMDLLALADYSGKQKALTKIQKTKALLFVGDAPQELLGGSTIMTKLVVMNSTGKGVQSRSFNLYIIGNEADTSNFSNFRIRTVRNQTDIGKLGDFTVNEVVAVDKKTLDIYQVTASLLKTLVVR